MRLALRHSPFLFTIYIIFQFTIGSIYWKSWEPFIILLLLIPLILIVWYSAYNEKNNEPNLPQSHSLYLIFAIHIVNITIFLIKYNAFRYHNYYDTNSYINYIFIIFYCLFNGYLYQIYLYTKKKIYLILTVVSTILLLLTGVRSLLLFQAVTFWFVYIQMRSITFKKFIAALIIIFLSGIALHIGRTVLPNNEYTLENELNDIPTLIDKQFERIFAESNSLSLIIDADNIKIEKYKLLQLNNLQWIFIPRYFVNDKPILNPGRDFSTLFLNNSKISYPTELIGNLYVWFGYKSVLIYSIWMILLLILYRITLIKFFESQWLINVYFLTELFLSTHISFYLTSWLRILPVYLLIYLVINGPIHSKIRDLICQMRK